MMLHRLNVAVYGLSSSFIQCLEYMMQRPLLPKLYGREKLGRRPSLGPSFRMTIVNITELVTLLFELIKS
ncbi:hypothetical protein PC111_g10921 [Phytophthora cactorum]|nr:hypothetical protein PC111_g10921 [Phytophthora cactorum]